MKDLTFAQFREWVKERQRAIGEEGMKERMESLGYWGDGMEPKCSRRFNISFNCRSLESGSSGSPIEILVRDTLNTNIMVD